MKHELHTDHEKKLICCTLEGELDIEESFSLSISLRQQATESGFGVLYDARKLQEPKSIMPVHDFTVKLSSALDNTTHRSVKVAFLRKDGNFDDYWEVYEKSATSRGLRIKIFTEKEEAVTWLSI